MNDNSIEGQVMIVVVGLGAMGGGIGAALGTAGFTVTGVEPSAAQAEAWNARTGLPVVTRIADASWSDARYAVIAVRTEAQVTQVLSDIPVDFTGSVVIVSTLSIGFARDLPRLSPLCIIEAPVSGGQWGAEQGDLTTFLHSPQSDPGADEVVSAFSGRVFRFGAYGDAAAAKLVNNALGAYNAFATRQVLGIAVGLGLDARTFLDIVNTSSGHSWMSEHFLEFPEDLLWKDVNLLFEDIEVLPPVSLTPSTDFVQQVAAGREALRTMAETDPSDTNPNTPSKGPL